MEERWPLARSVILTSASGWLEMASPWTGPIIQTANTARCSAKPSRLAAEFGKAATSSLGYTVSAFEPAGDRPTALTVQAPTLRMCFARQPYRRDRRENVFEGTCP